MVWWRTGRVSAFSLGLRLTVVRAFDFIDLNLEADVGNRIFAVGARRVDGRAVPQVRASEEAS